MSEAATTDLIRALTGNLSRAQEGWQALSVVLELDGGRCTGTYGYTYRNERTPAAVSVRPRLVADRVRAYLAGHLPHGARPVRMLVQYDRTTGRHAITFEATDPSRWQVTPANIDAIREELRPRLA